MIELNNVVKHYKSGVVQTTALDDVTARINAGDYTIVLGPSGSGKSTMLNLMGALDVPSSGRVLVDGALISEMNQRDRVTFRRNTLGFVFQDYNVLNTLSVRENVELGAYLSTDPMTVASSLKAVGLEGFESRYPYELSGGERQRLSIARAFVKRPKILFFDEPTGSLDEALAKDILKVIDALNQQGTTIVLITHNEAIRHVGTHVLRLKSGRIHSFEKNAVRRAPAEITF